MVNEYSGTADADLDRDASAEGAEVQETEGEQPQAQQQQQDITLTDAIDAAVTRALQRELPAQLRRELQYVNSRLQSISDRTAGQYDATIVRIEQLAAQGEDVRGLVDDLHALSVDPSDREKRALQRQLAQAEQRAKQQQPATQPQNQPQQQQQAAPDDWETHLAGLVAYGNAKGFSAAEMNDQNWMGRLYSVGMPAVETFRTNAEYTAALRRAMDALAQQKYDAGKKQVRNPNVMGVGSGRRNELDDYHKALREGKSLPSADEIDRITARLLAGSG